MIGGTSEGTSACNSAAHIGGSKYIFHDFEYKILTTTSILLPWDSF